MSFDNRADYNHFDSPETGDFERLGRENFWYNPIKQKWVDSVKGQGTQSGLDAKYEIGFEAPLGIANRKPIHESIAIVAFINSSIQFPSGTKYDNLDQKQWEFIRGLIWNDDPSCLLLADLSENNHKFGIGLQFFDAFLFGPANCMTKRSHFGNLQFLHAMATKVGEPAQTTKQNLMSWLEVMYKLACLNQGISANDQLVTRLPNHFDSSTVPTGSATLKELILATTPSYNEMKIEDRALGICLHIIQDSYAIGHTQRSLLNPQDLAPRDPQGFIQFKSKTFGNYGPIIAFHTYVGQNEERHSHYDKIRAGAALPTPKDLDSFNGIIGARAAIDASTKLINFFNAGTKWDDGVRHFLSDEVFALDPHVQLSNTEVDPKGLSFGTTQAVMETQKKDEKSYLYCDSDSEGGAGGDSSSMCMARKSEKLEEGFAAPKTDSLRFSCARYFEHHSWLRAVFLSILTLFGVAVAMALSMVLWVLLTPSIVDLGKTYYAHS